MISRAGVIPADDANCEDIPWGRRVSVLERLSTSMAQGIPDIIYYFRAWLKASHTRPAMQLLRTQKLCVVAFQLSGYSAM